MANMPASVHTLLMSAPVEFGHNLHKQTRSSGKAQQQEQHNGGPLGHQWFAAPCSTITSQPWLPTFHSHCLVRYVFTHFGSMAFFSCKMFSMSRCAVTGCAPREQLEADVALAVHGAGVDLEDLGARLQVRQAKLHLPVQPPRPQQRWVQRVRPVGRHQHLPCMPTSDPI